MLLLLLSGSSVGYLFILLEEIKQAVFHAITLSIRDTELCQTTKKDNPLNKLALQLHIIGVNPGVFLQSLMPRVEGKEEAMPFV